MRCRGKHVPGIWYSYLKAAERGILMSLTKSWYTVDQAAAKYGIFAVQINKWVERGLVRTEENNGELLVNGNDIEQELHLVPSL
jgi:hypothetical protein